MRREARRRAGPAARRAPIDRGRARRCGRPSPSRSASASVNAPSPAPSSSQRGPAPSTPPRMSATWSAWFIARRHRIVARRSYVGVSATAPRAGSPSTLDPRRARAPAGGAVAGRQRAYPARRCCRGTRGEHLRVAGDEGPVAGGRADDPDEADACGASPQRAGREVLGLRLLPRRRAARAAPTSPIEFQHSTTSEAPPGVVDERHVDRAPRLGRASSAARRGRGSRRRDRAAEDELLHGEMPGVGGLRQRGLAGAATRAARPSASPMRCQASIVSPPPSPRSARLTDMRLSTRSARRVALWVRPARATGGLDLRSEARELLAIAPLGLRRARAVRLRPAMIGCMFIRGTSPAPYPPGWPRDRALEA